MKLWRKPFDSSTKAAPPSKVSINKERCKGCGYCTEYCPREVLKLSDELGPKGYNSVVITDENKCLGCGLCEVICPDFAIKVNTAKNKVN